MAKIKALDRAGRKQTIKLWFEIKMDKGDKSPKTSYAIAKGLGLSASDKLRKILNEMVDDGTLERTPLEKQGRWKGSGYMLKEGTYQKPRRTISFRCKGIVINQEVLF